MVRQRPPSIGARCSVKKFVHCGDVVIFHLTFDLKKSHRRRLPFVGSGPFALVELSGWTLGLGGSNVIFANEVPANLFAVDVGHPPPDSAERRLLSRGRCFVFS